MFLTALFFQQNNASNPNTLSFENTHLMDERLELVALVFRLAGKTFYTSELTNYQQSLVEHFYQFKDHPAVTFSSIFPDDEIATGISMYLIRKGDTFLLNTCIAESRNLSSSSIFKYETFVDFLNCFYKESNFQEFFYNQYEYFVSHSEHFINEVYRHVNHDWFIDYGVHPQNMNVILSPSMNPELIGGFSFHFTNQSTNEKTVYAIVPTHLSYLKAHHLPILIHEYVHPFADEIAYEWFWSNCKFRDWSVETFNNMTDLALLRSPLIIAKEYLTQAYTILYLVENTNMSLSRLLYINRFLLGLTYIQEVFTMITQHEYIELRQPTLDDLELPKYTLSDVNTYIHNGNEITWQFLNFNQLVDFTSILIPNCIEGAAFGSTTNDVFYIHVGNNKQLIIDLGCGVLEGFTEGIRMVHRFHID